MKHVGQIGTNQYGLKRKRFLPDSHRGRNENSPAHYNLNSDYIQNRTKPLQVRTTAQVSFKGFNILSLQSSLRPVIKPIPEKLTQKVFDSLKNISSTQYEYYQKVRKNYVDLIKLPTQPPKNEEEILLQKAGENFRKRNGITDEMAQNISEKNLFYLPKKRLAVNFITQVAAPITAVLKFVKKTLLPKNKELLQQRELENKITGDFAALQGLIKSHEIWENGYRQFSGHQKWNKNSDFLIPDEVLYGKIQRRRNKIVDPNKGKYSSTSMMLGNRLISGLVYSYFLGTDAYNTTMRYSNNEKEAAVQRNSRVAQEFSRIGMNMYVQNLLFGTFETAVNKSLATAMFVSGSTVAFSEVLGRKLVGKPIMPSDKETLDRLENEMNSKKGILPAIGRLLTNVKKKDASASKQKPRQNKDVIVSDKPANQKLFSSFTKENTAKTTSEKPSQKTTFNASKSPSFKGFYKVDYLFDKKKLAEIIKIVEMSDEKTAQSLKECVLKSVKKSKYSGLNNELKPKTYDEILKAQDLELVPVGHKKTTWGLWVSSILVPVKFLKNLSVSAYKHSKKFINNVSGKKDTELVKEFNAFQAKNDSRYQNFVDYYNNQKELNVWKHSKLSEEEKQLRLYKEFKDIKSKEAEEIEGAKNILLWLEKQFKREGIKINEDGTFDEKHIDKVKDLFLQSVMRADSSKHVEYDGNVLAQTNINLSRAITTLFLMADSYNLTMQYSNDNKKDAQKSASNRAAQELSRIGVSAYMLAFVHNLLSKLCNSSLAGAFTLTALTSSINDSLSRKVVGVPLTAKSQEELHEIDKQNAKSKSPIRKALAYSIGKKSALAQAGSTDKDTIDNYFNSNYFIKPEII